MRRLLSAVLALAAAACALPAEPYALTYFVTPRDGALEIEVEVRGGEPTAWIGFGVGPGASADVVDRIRAVRAVDETDRQLDIESVGAAAFRVRSPGHPWRLRYTVELEPDRRPTFYRSSTYGDDFYVIVGSDVWARFFTDRAQLAAPPAARSGGTVTEAYAHFSLPDDEWSVVSTEWQDSPTMFEMRRHPVGSVFAVGPFGADAGDPEGLRIAQHSRWNVLPDAIATMTSDLLASHRRQIGSPGDNSALALLLPLPRGVRANRGLRTAGMVRGQTLIMYAGLTGQAPYDSGALSAAMSVFVGHELFHLWVPSGIQVGRDVSWLSEGWAMHRARAAALDSGWMDAEHSQARLQASYRQYLGLGGYRAGSLPEASVGSEQQRELLYLRGELVLRLLEKEWQPQAAGQTFEQQLWSRLASRYDGREPLSGEDVRSVLAELVDPVLVRRYVEGRAPLTPATLGLAGR